MYEVGIYYSKTLDVHLSNIQNHLYFTILPFLCHIGALLLIINKINVFQILFLIKILGNKINFIIFLILIYIIPIISYYLIHTSFYLYYKIKKDFKNIELKRLSINYSLSYDIFTPVLFICLFILFFPINIVQCIVYLIDGTWFPIIKICLNYPKYSKPYWFWLLLVDYGEEGDLKEVDRLLKIFITDKKSNWSYEYFIFRLILIISYFIIIIDINFLNIYPFYLLLLILILWNLKNILKRFIFNKKIRENIEKFAIRLDNFEFYCTNCPYVFFFFLALIDMGILHNIFAIYYLIIIIIFGIIHITIMRVLSVIFIKVKD
ncbi:MAG: hypothetical protein ACTSPQ_22530 [Candidatus Helarchaeota archaeon]